MSQDSDLQKVIDKAQAQGFRYNLTNNNHHQFKSPNGHDIVVCAGTPSDTRGWDNFLADMRRAGYVHEPLGTMGDLMPKPPNGGAKLSVTQYVIDALSRHSEGLSVEDLQTIVRSQRPELHPNNVYGSLRTLMDKGICRRLPSKLYMLTDVDRSHLQPHPGRVQTPQVNGHAVPTVVIGARTGDDAIDADLAALDDALAALARIETVVRKNREVLAQLAKLKEALK